MPELMTLTHFEDRIIARYDNGETLKIVPTTNPGWFTYLLLLNGKIGLYQVRRNGGGKTIEDADVFKAAKESGVPALADLLVLRSGYLYVRHAFVKGRPLKSLFFDRTVIAQRDGTITVKQVRTRELGQCDVSDIGNDGMLLNQLITLI